MSQTLAEYIDLIKNKLSIQGVPADLINNSEQTNLSLTREAWKQWMTEESRSLEPELSWGALDPVKRESDESGMELNRYELTIMRRVISGTHPISVGDYFEAVHEDEDLQHWSDRERLTCMTKLQNLGLIVIKTAERQGVEGMRTTNGKSVLGSFP